MKFKIDENLPIEIAELLRQAGHDATTVLEEQIGGCTDAMLAALCRQENRALVTLDMDFADIRGYPPAEFPGLVVLCLRQQDKPCVLDLFARLVRVLHEEPLEGHLWIVEEGRIRIRGQPR
jgi:predicted nuclease of predicted toxin-antitoxin system